MSAARLIERNRSPPGGPDRTDPNPSDRSELREGRSIESLPDAGARDQRRRDRRRGPADAPPCASRARRRARSTWSRPTRTGRRTARSITTRSPLWVEEIEFDDGDAASRPRGRRSIASGSPTSACWGSRPDLIVSGINHGANLGDDITYSGTVAAALRGDRPRDPGDRDLPAVHRPRDGLSVRPQRSTSAWPPPSRPSWSAGSPRTRCPRAPPERELSRRASPRGSR